MKKVFLALVSAASLGAFAAEGGSNPLDSITQELGTQLTSWSTAITNFFTSNASTIFGIIGVAIGFALVWVGLRLFKKATSKAG